MSSSQQINSSQRMTAIVHPPPLLSSSSKRAISLVTDAADPIWTHLQLLFTAQQFVLNRCVLSTSMQELSQCMLVTNPSHYMLGWSDMFESAWKVCSKV